jgi:exodeoxyribonuclease V alpha subunit
MLETTTTAPANESPRAVAKKSTTVAGVVRALTYRDELSGFFVARVDTASGREVTVVGTAAVIHPGESLSAKGGFESSVWGPQFKATDVTVTPPRELEHIERYLATAVPGIGPSFAKKLVGAFGATVLEVIEKQPESLRNVPGVGPKRAGSIVQAYSEQAETRKAMLFLTRLGLTPGRAQKIFKYFGPRTQQVLEENPYKLCDVWGIGFKLADEAARRHGIAHDSNFRVRAGMLYLLREAEGNGSCGLPEPLVVEKAAVMLQVSESRVLECLAEALQEKDLVRANAAGETCLFLPRIYRDEKTVAQLLLERAGSAPGQVLEDIDYAILDVELDMEITLEDAQREAVRAALTKSVCVITGGPGTGKTTITRVILTVLDQAGLRVMLAAPTGKAAKRASEATGFEAKTIHRLLEVQRAGGFKYNAENPLAADVVALDEMSMVDVRLFRSALEAVAPGTRVILLGDVDQLPSVGPGKVLADVIASGSVPTVRLTEVFRQAKTSHIIRNAHAINAGVMPELGWDERADFGFLRYKSQYGEAGRARLVADIEGELLRRVHGLYERGFDPVRDVQVLAPMRKGPLGTIALNQKLREVLNPHPADEVTVLGNRWCVGDKVIQLKNAYQRGDNGVFNGDIGYVLSIDHEGRTLRVEFDVGVIEYEFLNLDELALAYALTVHKSQGSEFPVVVMPLDVGSHYMMLKRNLVYTAVTRARQLMVVLGTKEAMDKALENSQVEERYSRLREWLQSATSASVNG